MSSTLTVTFQFDIGDLVYFVDTPNTLTERPRAFCVYERLAHECHGGVQRLYKISGYRDTVSETCLRKTPPPYTPMSDTEIREREEEKLRKFHTSIRLREAADDDELGDDAGDEAST